MEAIRRKGRPRKQRNVSNLTKLEKEEIYYQYENGGRDMTISAFADQMRMSPIDMSKFLREYQVATGEDVDNALKTILKSDSLIVKSSQEFILEFMDDIRKSKKKIDLKTIETILKAADNSLKRQTIIDKMMTEKADKTKTSSDITVKITL